MAYWHYVFMDTQNSPQERTCMGTFIAPGLLRRHPEHEGERLPEEQKMVLCVVSMHRAGKYDLSFI